MDGLGTPDVFRQVVLEDIALAAPREVFEPMERGY